MSTKPTKKAADGSGSEPTAGKSAAQAGTTSSVTFKRSHPGYAYWPGDTADLEATAAAELIEGGFAELFVPIE